MSDIKALRERAIRIEQTLSWLETDLSASARLLSDQPPDPKSALGKTRIAVERMTKRLYSKFGLPIPPKTKEELGGMLNNNQFTRHLPRRIQAALETVRQYGNLGAHDAGPVREVDALVCLLVAQELSRWYGETFPEDLSAPISSEIHDIPVHESPPIGLSFDHLAMGDFWHQRRASIHGTSVIPLVIVLPSGRHPKAHNGQLALISDALYTHELCFEIEKVANSVAPARLSVQSMLDIDYYSYLDAMVHGDDKLAEDETSPINSNLLVLATADINVVAGSLLARVRSFEKYGCGYEPPYEECKLKGGRGQLYSAQRMPNIGALGLYPVPWSTKQRVAMFCGGINAPGTLAANRLLLRYLQGLEHGDNAFKPNVPMKIVNCTRRRYQYSTSTFDSLRTGRRKRGPPSNETIVPYEQCEPQHDLCNIGEELVVQE